jgi:hypothetical protein
MKKFLKTFTEWKLNEEQEAGDPQMEIDKVLRAWQEVDPEGWFTDIVQDIESNGFDVKTLYEIGGVEDIPERCVIFTYEDDPLDFCYYRDGSKLFEVSMETLNPEPLDFLDVNLEELIGVELDFVNEFYEDKIVTVSDPKSDWQNITKSDLEDFDFNIPQDSEDSSDDEFDLPSDTDEFQELDF